MTDDQAEEFIVNIQARIQTVEFFVEVLMAQLYARVPKDEADEALTNIRAQITERTSLPQGDEDTVETAQLIHADMKALAERLASRVSLRADEIRADLHDG